MIAENRIPLQFIRIPNVPAWMHIIPIMIFQAEPLYFSFIIVISPVLNVLPCPIPRFVFIQNLLFQSIRSAFVSGVSS
jgi:hypothetical protein